MRLSTLHLVSRLMPYHIIAEPLVQVASQSNLHMCAEQNLLRSVGPYWLCAV